jgi:hypothetical protein
MHSKYPSSSDAALQERKISTTAFDVLRSDESLERELAGVQKRAELVVDMQRQFQQIVGKELPKNPIACRDVKKLLDNEVQQFEQYIDLLHRQEPTLRLTKSGVENQEELAQIMKQSPKVYYPIRVVSEFLSPVWIMPKITALATVVHIASQHTLPISLTPSEVAPLSAVFTMYLMAALQRITDPKSKGLSTAYGNLSMPNQIAGASTKWLNKLSRISKVSKAKGQKVDPIEQPELATDIALLDKQDPQVRKASVHKLLNLFGQRLKDLHTAQGILEQYESMTFPPSNEFKKQSARLGRHELTPAVALDSFTEQLLRAELPLREKVLNLLQDLPGLDGQAAILQAEAPEFMVVGAHADPDMVVAWKLFIEALNTYPPLHRASYVTNLLKSISEANEMLGSPLDVDEASNH